MMNARLIKLLRGRGRFILYTASAIECGCIMSRTFALSFTFAALVFCASAVCARGIEPLLTTPIDESQRVTLPGNSPAALKGAADRGSVDDNLQLDHLLLVLKGSSESEAALRTLIDEQHNPAADQYHHWLTPEQIGERFGLADADLDALRSWLQSHGFTVNRIFNNGLVIDFSGTAAQVRATFSTEIHQLVLPSGEHHIANTRSPQIPTALAPAVAGVASLHDLFPRSHAVALGPVSYDRATNTWTPHFNINIDGSVFHTLAPYDFATIYDLLPMWARGYTGKGITIAAVEDSNLLHTDDWKTFRKTFGLDGFTAGNFRQIYPGCTNPGQNGDETEAALDVEWSSAA